MHETVTGHSPLDPGGVAARPWTAPLQSDQAAALRFYIQAVAAYEQAVAAASAGHTEPDLAPLQRTVQRAVDTVSDDSSLLLGLTTIKGLKVSPGRTVRTHGVNTMILAVTLAHAAGLSRTGQSRVGLAALLHDLVRDTGLDSAPHGIATANALLRFRTLEEVALVAVTALAHDLSVAPAGAPEDAAAAMVRIADAYDTLTAREGLDGSPDWVLVFLLRSGAARFDAALVRCFARLLGTYPPGTTVQLEDGSAGVVVRPAAAGTPDCPLVRVCRTAGGKPVTGEVWARSGSHVVRSVDAALLGIDRVRVFLPQS
jgi:hypothetical protein